MANDKSMKAFWVTCVVEGLLFFALRDYYGHQSGDRAAIAALGIFGGGFVANVVALVTMGHPFKGGQDIFSLFLAPIFAGWVPVLLGLVLK